jgi:hypothetical protein
MHSYLRQSTASQSRTLGPFVDDTDFKTAKTALTIANTDIKLMANGGTSANKNSGGGTHRVNGHYGVTFDATDTATVGALTVSVVVSSALPVMASFCVVEEAVYDALFAASSPGYVANAPVNVAQFGGNNGTFASGRPEVNTTHAAGTAWASGAITATAIASDAIAAAKIATGAITNAKFAAGAIDAAAIAANAIADTKIATGAFTAAKFASGAFDAVWSVSTRTLTAFDSAFKTGYSLAATGLDAIAQSATGMVEIAKAVWDRVLTGGTHNIAASAGRRLRTVPQVELDAGTAQAGGASTITLQAGANATNDYYTPGLVVTLAGTGALQARRISGYDGGTRVATVSTPWTVEPDNTTEYQIIPWATVRVSEMDAGVDAYALLTTTQAEPGQGAPAATISPIDSGRYLYKWARNKKDNDGDTTQYYADDGTTVDHKQTTTGGSTVTKDKVVSGP